MEVNVATEEETTSTITTESTFTLPLRQGDHAAPGGGVLHSGALSVSVQVDLTNRIKELGGCKRGITLGGTHPERVVESAIVSAAVGIRRSSRSDTDAGVTLRSLHAPSSSRREPVCRHAGDYGHCRSAQSLAALHSRGSRGDLCLAFLVRGPAADDPHHHGRAPQPVSLEEERAPRSSRPQARRR